VSVGVMTFDQRADAAAAAVLSDLLAKIEANHEGAMEGSDLECLHDFRVATRRTRSVQRELKHAFPPGPLRHFRGEFKWLQTVTGPARDLDVYVESFDDSRRLVPEDMRADLEPLLELLQARRRDARREMVAALSSERAAAALADWRSLLDQLEQLPESDRPDASRRIGDLSGARIRKVYKRIVRLGRPIKRSSPSEAYHELRKQGKELRYLLELFGAKLYPAEVVKPMVKALKALQDVLGRHQDRQVQVALLLGIREELAGRSRAALTPLIENLMRDQLAARDQFAQRFEAIASKQQRKLVRKSF
jgi:CHAD domain-containing protein